MENPSELTKQILRKVRQVEIRTNRMVTDALAGAYHSIFKGQGMDFEEVREYTPGDDVRSIDWNVTAKMDKPFVKKHREERELTIMLMVDVSGSGEFGSIHESKRELAAELASVLAFSATKNNDKVGLILFTDKIEKFISPKKGRHHVLRLIREILFFKPENRGTDISSAIDYLNNVCKRKAVVFLLSDFLQSANGELPSPKLNASHKNQDPLILNLEITNRRHDLICIHLNDMREVTIPPVGIVTLEDSETGELIELDTQNKKVRNLYEKFNRGRIEQIKRVLKQKGIDQLTLWTHEPYINSLREFLKMRLSRRR